MALFCGAFIMEQLTGAILPLQSLGAQKMLLSEKRKNNLLSRGMTIIGTSCAGKIVWYEHPIYGDNVGMLAFYEGRIYSTDIHEVPSDDELSEAELIECYST